MYYDQILNKMIPGIFAPINNKTLNGYNEIFSYIKECILAIIKNNK